MAYIFIDKDGDEAIHFERGKWDSFWGYYCPECKSYIGNPQKAMEHENELPCQNNPDEWKNVVFEG